MAHLNVLRFPSEGTRSSREKVAKPARKADTFCGRFASIASGESNGHSRMLYQPKGSR